MSSSWKRETKLLLSSDSEDEDNGPRKTTGGFLAINKDYASRYESWRGKEEIQKFKDRFGATSLENGEEESSSSSSDSDAEELVNDKQFLKALSCLKKKDPIIYDDKLNFFPENPTSTSSDADRPKKRKKIDKKPFLLKDHERKMILEGDFDPEAEDEVIPEPKISYYQEQNDIRTKITAVASKVSDDEDDGDLLLKARAKSAGEVEAEEEEYKKWLKGQTDKMEGGSSTKTDEKELKFLRDYWNDPKLDAGEQFLRDYILNRKYVTTTTADKDKIPTYSEIVDSESENDEAELEKMEEFEQKFNFRFEEPDPEFIKKYPRTVENSIRRKETKRREERERVREARKKEKERKATEIQQLKAFSRKQILDKIRLLQESSGDLSNSLGFTDADVDGDFDPDEYDSRAQAIFNEEYYANCGDEEKPVFSDMEYEEGDDEILAEENIKNVEKIKNGGQSDSGEGNRGSDVEVNEPGPSRKRVRKGKRVLEALDVEKSKMNNLERKLLEDEYHKLDFEDIIGGDILTRFKYREVVANDFGLSADEILAAPDRELNRWASLKRTYLQRSEEEELYDLHAYAVKKNDYGKKKRLLASLYAPEEEAEVGSGDEEEVEVVGGSKKKKRKKQKRKKIETAEARTEVGSGGEEQEEKADGGSKMKKRKKNKNENQTEVSVATEVVNIKNKPSAAASTPPPTSDATGKKKRKRKNKNKNGTEANSATPMSSGNKNKKGKGNQKPPVMAAKPDRLAAFGINPKKYEKWVKYGGGNSNSSSAPSAGKK